MSKSVVVMLADGFEEIEAVTPVDVLRRAFAEVFFLGLTDSAKGARGVTYLADQVINDYAGIPDLLVFPGGLGGAQNLGSSAEAKQLAEKTAANGSLVAAICAAPVFTLGAWGMLDNKQATCYPGMEKEFPDTVVFSSQRVVVDGNIITSRGPGTALQFSLELVAQLYGQEKAATIAEAMVVQ
ncbi:MAG: DJ-1/PfpI family protein [Planctomycetes bacterium]|nr:DJ-1/PfpI family protein [Planctomycetota bacterium]